MNSVEIFERSRRRAKLVAIKPLVPLRDADAKIKAYAAELFERATDAEIALYETLSTNNIKFEFQKPIVCKHATYIVDFLIRTNLYYLVIEVDGKYHQKSEQRKKDKNRDGMLKSEFNAITLRFTNRQVMNDVVFVLGKIQSFLKTGNKLTA